MSLPSTILSGMRPAIMDHHVLKKARPLAEKVRNYGAMFFWLLSDVYSHFRWRSLRVLLSSALYLCAKFAAVGVMYYLIDSLENKRQDVILGVTLPSPDSPALLALGLGGMLVCLFVAAGLSFELTRLCLAMGRQYEEFCAKRTLMLMSWLPHHAAAWATDEVKSGRVSSQISYARMCGRVAAQLGEAIPALVGFAIASIILLVIDPGLTVIIALLGFLAFIAQYPANRRAVRANRLLHENRRASSRHLKAALSNFREAPAPISMDSSVLKRPLLNDSVQATLGAMVLRRRVSSEAKLASEFGNGLILAVVLFIIGAGIMEGSRSWGEAVVYLAALRFALRDFGSTMRMPVSINRFYIEMVSLHAFTSSASKAVNASDETAAKPFEQVCFDLPAVDGALGALTAEAGACLAVVVPRKARPAVPIMLYEAQKALPNDTPRRVVPIDTMLIDPLVPLRASLAVPQSLEASQLAASLEAFAPEGEVMDWATQDWLDRTPEEPWDTVLPEWAIYALQALAAIARGQRLIMIRARIFDDMDARWRDALKACIADGLLILLHNKIGSLGSHGEKTVILCNTKGAREWAEWDDSSETRSLLEEAYARITGEEAQQTAGAVDTEILDDEDEDEESLNLL